MAFDGVISVFLLFVLAVLCHCQDGEGQNGDGNGNDENMGHDFYTLREDTSAVRVRRSIETGQIMELVLKCPDQDMNTATLSLLHDGEAYATARCKNGNFTFVRKDIAHLELTMTLNSTMKGVCQMWKPSGKTYSVIASYAPGTEDSAMFVDTNMENAICNFDDVGHAFGNITRITKPFSRPADKPIYKGDTIPHNITMQVLDVLDRPLGTKSISMSRLIRLRATIHSQVLAIYALSCMAMNDAGSKYQIIKGSCGDGRVLRQDAGFVTRGNSTYSPYFKVFRLAGAHNLRFRCLFASCKIADCDNKNSCPYNKPVVTTPGITLPPPV